MNSTKRKPMVFFLLLFCVLIFSSCKKETSEDYQPKVTSEMVKEEFLHAWNAYKVYAWGHDALKPLSKSYRDWYGTPLMMTPVDAFDTMFLMGLKAEAEEVKQLIFNKLSFHVDLKVQSFEITIRLLGGLLSAYQLDGDIQFLQLAEDLGKRLLPVFNSPTGMPYRYVNLLTGETSDFINNPAEIGTALLEFGTLSKLTEDPMFYEKALNAVVQLYNHRSQIGLVGTTINVNTGEWINKNSHLGGRIDSYYEYLLKSWLLFGDVECKNMWENSIEAINTYLADNSENGLWYGQADMETGKRTTTRFGALSAFFPAVLALDGDMARAAKLQESCFKMWKLHGIEPELIDYSTMEVLYKNYPLRPEIVESVYYLYHYTKNPMYLQMGEVFLDGFVKYCKTEAGYASLSDVVTKEKEDSMPSFFLAETLKYLFLLFASDNILSLDKVIYNTEAHPLQRTWE